MKLSRLLLLLPFLSGLAQPVSAAGNPPAPVPATTSQSWYDIEIIVFSNTDPQAGNLETWPADPGVPDWNGATALLVSPVAANNTSIPALASTPALTPTPFMQLDKYQLDYDWNRLKHSHDYEPLLHVAWVEPLTDHTTAPSVRIGVPPPAPAVINAGVAIATQPSPAATTPAPTVTPAPLPTPAYGTVKFSQYGPYLHLDLDLVYRGPLAKRVIAVPSAVTHGMTAVASTAVPVTTVQAPSVSGSDIYAPATAANTSASAMTAQTQSAPANFQWYRMTQDRRIEAGKLNYFDNPMFGVLVLVTPHPLAAPATK